MSSARSREFFACGAMVSLLPGGHQCPHAPAEETAMDAIVLLREDHTTVENPFKRFEMTDDDDLAEPRANAAEVIEELTAHAWAEEQVSHPAAARAAAPQTTDHIPDVRKAIGRNRFTELGDQLESDKEKTSRNVPAMSSVASR
ncbi:hypothetical protein ACFWBX_03120 [Streptomyces sp. NPDC059991]|uniref:hypothetical protein n=1 Tax=Streptomyces sp. NPDC059991 TaxID=3347028 RepID=UPI0036B71E1E